MSVRPKVVLPHPDSPTTAECLSRLEGQGNAIHCVHLADDLPQQSGTDREVLDEVFDLEDRFALGGAIVQRRRNGRLGSRGHLIVGELRGVAFHLVLEMTSGYVIRLIDRFKRWNLLDANLSALA